MQENIILGDNLEKLSPIGKEIADLIVSKKLSYLEAMTVIEIAQNEINNCEIC